MIYIFQTVTPPQQRTAPSRRTRRCAFSHSLLTESDLEGADHEREESVVAKAAAVVSGRVGAGSALEEAVHLPLQESQGAWWAAGAERGAKKVAHG